MTSILVNKKELSNIRVVRNALPALKEGQVLVEVEKFGFTANNITYGVTGDRIGYFNFFPTAEEGFACLPVWGYGVVVSSQCEALPVGERFFGFLPMSSHAVLTPVRVGASRFVDGTPHRRPLPPVYNSYLRVPSKGDRLDSYHMVLFPLYATSYALADFYNSKGWFGARCAILPSASSKTAIGTAYAIKNLSPDLQVVGLTSKKHVSTLRSLGTYDRVISYDDIESEVDATIPSVIIDLSGNGRVLARLHKCLDSNMKFTSFVGITHIREYDAGHSGLIKGRGSQFFAPGHILKREKELGSGVYQDRALAFSLGEARRSTGWLSIKHAVGSDAAVAAYLEVLENRTPANQAWTMTLGGSTYRSSL